MVVNVIDCVEQIVLSLIVLTNGNGLIVTLMVSFAKQPKAFVPVTVNVLDTVSINVGFEMVDDHGEAERLCRFWVNYLGFEH